MRMEQETPLVVAGGGAAGMMAAIAAAELGCRVILVEPNEKVGRKLYITGKGRCNVTNACDQDTLMAHMVRNRRFLYSALSRFSPWDTMDFFEGLGIPLKIERGNRVFPVSDRSADIIDGLFFRLRDLGVSVVQDRVCQLVVEQGILTGVCLAKQGKTPCKGVILATGGASYPRTGSTGDGYRLAEQVGHRIVPVRGSLVPLASNDPCCKRLQGLSLRNVRASVTDWEGRCIYDQQGELLFTHFGLSGPLMLSASAHMDGSDYVVHIDLKPALDRQKLDQRLLRDFADRSNQDFVNALGSLLPKAMIPVVVERSGIAGDTKVHNLRRAQRQRLLELLKDFTIPIQGLRPVAEAVITAGGVDVGPVNPGTMASKLVRGLYFAGEVLDVDAYTGGFNLQIAWATGRAAGQGAANWARKEAT